MKFFYRARTEEGDIQTGSIEASSREGALEILQQYGLYVTLLRKDEANFWQQKISFLREASKKDIISFTRQISIMLNSDMSLVSSLETIARQTKKVGFKEKILRAADQIEGGSTFSQALASLPDTFSTFYIGMLKAGETSGKISEALTYLADYLEKEDSFISKATTALIYPSFVMVVFFAIVLIISIFVVPSFEEVFLEMGIEMPLLTRIVIAVSKIIRGSWWVLVILISGFIPLIISISKQEEAKRSLDRALLDIPVVGDFLQKFFLSRIALNLSTLISGGVPITQALEVTGDLVGNRVYKEIMIKTRDAVRSGKSISSVLSLHPKRFSVLFIQMIVTGEKTGHMETSLLSIVKFYEEEVGKMLNMVIKFLEPAMIVVLGVLITILSLSLFVPLFQQGISF